MNKRFIATLKRSDDGKVVIPFKNNKGEVFGELRIDPNDIGLPIRFQKLRVDIKLIAEMVGSIQKINNDGTVSDLSIPDRWTMADAEKDLKQSFDWCFGEGTYESLFSQRRPFASVEGTFFVSNVIEELDKNVFTMEELKE